MTGPIKEVNDAMTLEQNKVSKIHELKTYKYRVDLVSILYHTWTAVFNNQVVSYRAVTNMSQTDMSHIDRQ